MKRIILICIFFLRSISSFSLESIKVNNGEYLIDFDSLLIKWKSKDEDIILSSSQEYSKTKIIYKTEREIKIERKDTIILFNFFDDYISVKGELKSENFLFPFIRFEADEFILPLKNGKRIPADDKIWNKYLENKLDKAQGSSTFSMNFFVVKSNGKYITYTYDNRYHNEISYKDKKIEFLHNFSKLSKNNEITFKIYHKVLTITESAKLYRNELIKTGKFKALKEKIKENKNIEKLLGAPL